MNKIIKAIAASDAIDSSLDRQAVNNLLDEMRRQKYADIEHAQAPNIFDYEDYHQYKLDQEYYETKLLENAYKMPPERQAEIKAIRERREKENKKSAVSNFFAELGMWIEFIKVCLIILGGFLFLGLIVYNLLFK